MLPDGQILFHDGITTGQNMIYQGVVTNNGLDLSICEGRAAVNALYVRV